MQIMGSELMHTQMPPLSHFVLLVCARMCFLENEARRLLCCQLRAKIDQSILLSGTFASCSEKGKIGFIATLFGTDCVQTTLQMLRSLDERKG